MKLSEIKPGARLWTYWVSSRLYDYDWCEVFRVKVVKKRRFGAEWEVDCDDLRFRTTKQFSCTHTTLPKCLFATKRQAEIGLAERIREERDDLCKMVDDVLKRLKVKQ